MKKYQSYSILKEITDEIFSSNNFKQSKENILKFVTSKNIDSKDKFKNDRRYKQMLQFDQTPTICCKFFIKIRRSFTKFI